MRIEIKDKKNFISMFNKIYKNNNVSNINGISIDSRKIMENDIYIPIKGKKYDGHDYITESFKKGAIISFSEQESNDKNIINTKSIPNEIKKLAKSWSELSKSKIIGITGSNGKTTTKNLIFHILEKKFNCNKTIGNYNSSIGFPISFLSSKINDQYCILEYGASKPNEIQLLCDIVSPDYSFITNISKAHIKNYKSLNDLINTKYAIYNSTKEDGIIFINTDELKVRRTIENKNIISFGFADKSKIKIKLDNNSLLINNKKILIPENLIYIKDIIIAVYMICYYLGVTNNNFQNSLKSFQIPSGRGNSIEYNNHQIIDDSYNANPNSVNFAINRISKIGNNGKKIFVLGDMLELGDIEIEEHNKLADSFNKSNIDIILTYGELSKDIHRYISKNKYSKHYSSKNKLRTELNNLVCKDDIVYLKGSRSMKLENLYINN